MRSEEEGGIAWKAAEQRVAGFAPGLDAICRIAARLFAMPIAFVNLMDERSHWLKGRWGVEPLAATRVSTFCNDTVRLTAADALVVLDLSADERYAHDALVTEAPFARFYAGVPIVLRSGMNIGTLCILDTAPRPTFGSAEIAHLHDLARSVEAHLYLHEAHLAQEAEAEERHRTTALLASKEQALQEVDRTQQLAEMAASFGHWRIDGDAWTITWSKGMARIFGTAMPPTGKRGLEDHLSLYEQEDRGAVRQAIVDAWAGRNLVNKVSYQSEGRVRFASGEEHHLLSQGIVERDARGAVSSLYGVTLDVTELKRSEHAARQTNALLRTTLENIDQGLLMIGPDDRILVSNDRVRDVLSVPGQMLSPGSSFNALRRHLRERGSFRTTTGSSKKAHADNELRTRQWRTRDDGMTFEVVTMRLPDGGMVRTYADVTRKIRDERAMRESERRFRLLAENTTDVVIWSDLDTTRRYVSPAARSVLGYDPEELVGTKPLRFVHPDDLDDYRRLLDDLCRGKMETVVTSQRYRRKDGTYVWIEASFSSIRDEPEGPITGYVASLRDITDRRRIEENLRVSEERQAMALDSGSDGIWDLDLASGAMRVSGPWLTILGYTSTDIPPHISAWEALMTHSDDLARAKSLLAAHLAGSSAKFECEYRLRSKGGGCVWALARGKVVARDAQGRATRVVGTIFDITRRKEAEALIEHMALHDPLTALANRTLFQDRLAQEIGHVERHGGSLAVLACDLDHFKNVNDTLGHTAGDRLLCCVADVLRTVVREGDTVARLGGDEFAIILRQINGARETSAIAERIVSAIGEPMAIDERSVVIGISIGIVISSAPSPGETADHLFKNADIALYRAKAEGRNAYRFFEPGMDALVAERSSLENDLRNAVKRREFTLHYQPFLDLRTDRVCGFEALLRWQHPHRGLIKPSDFVPLAEEGGLIVAIGDWVLDEACRQAALWSRDLCIAVNVSAEQFKQPHIFLQSVVAALSSSRLPPGRLELEVTESILIQDAEAVLGCLRNLRELGVRIALDDFGTGYSSLAYLRRFPFNKIKIDRAFVREINDPGTAAIVSAVVGLAARVGADITAEGVETAEQRDRVREVGCTQMQGFLFSEPVTAQEAAAMAMRRRPRAMPLAAMERAR